MAATLDTLYAWTSNSNDIIFLILVVLILASIRILFYHTIWFTHTHSHLNVSVASFHFLFSVRTIQYFVFQWQFVRDVIKAFISSLNIISIRLTIRITEWVCIQAAICISAQRCPHWNIDASFHFYISINWICKLKCTEFAIRIARMPFP